jgi:carbon-monoxide dehydrogenase large subunit
MTELFGTRVARLEDPRLLRGKGRYIDDIRLPGMLHAAFLRSPFAHARIKGVDASTALAMDGVHAVYTMDDLRPYLVNDRLVVGLPSPSYRQTRDRPALADGEVVYVGEPVAIVIADSRYLAEDASALVDVDYEPLGAVSDCRDALKPDAPPVHSGANHNLLAEFDMGFGDVDAAFAKAAHVFKQSTWIHRGCAHSIETRGGIATYDAGDDLITYRASTQMPHSALRTISEMLGRDENQLRVVSPDIGGGFGPKLVVYPEDVTLCIAAQKLERPVKWIEDRREHFIATTMERDQHWDMEMAVDEEGHILGLRGSMVHDHGAYTARGVNIAYNSGEAITLPYNVGAYTLNLKLVLTNKMPVTPVRGAGHPQACFTMERMLDRVARELNIDRAELRRRNLVQANVMPYEKPLKTRGGMPVLLDSGDYPNCQQSVIGLVGWDDFRAKQEEARKQGRYIGIGLGNFVKNTGKGPFESVTVRVGPSGKVHVYTGGVAIGQGTQTMLAMLVADQLGGDMSNITVTAGDTHSIALGMGTSNSRLAVQAGSTADAAARKVRDKALKIAAHMLEASEEDLEIVGGEIRVKGVSDMKVTLSQVANAVAGTPGYALPGGIEPGLEAEEHMVLDNTPYASGSAAAVVEVDIETGAVKIIDYAVGHDSGRIINPLLVDGQIMGGTAHGIGNALFEWMGYDTDGNPVTTNLAEYLMVSAPEMPPEVKMVHHESPSPLNPIGVKGVGECGVVPAPPAIVSAIEDALSPFNVHITNIPVSPAQIVAAIQAGQSAN